MHLIQLVESIRKEAFATTARQPRGVRTGSIRTPREAARHLARGFHMRGPGLGFSRREVTPGSYRYQAISFSLELAFRTVDYTIAGSIGRGNTEAANQSGLGECRSEGQIIDRKGCKRRAFLDLHSLDLSRIRLERNL